MTKAEKIKYLLIPAVGFGIGGAFWGLVEGSIFFGGPGIGVVLFGLFSIFSLTVLASISVYKKIIIALIGVLFWGIMFLVGKTIVFFSSIVFPSGIIIYFLLLWLIISLFYALALGLLLRIKMRSLFWRGAIGLVLSFIIILPGSEFFNLGKIIEISAFIIGGIIFGLFLGWGIYRGQKLKEIAEQKREKT